MDFYFFFMLLAGPFSWLIFLPVSLFGIASSFLAAGLILAPKAYQYWRYRDSFLLLDEMAGLTLTLWLLAGLLVGGGLLA